MARTVRRVARALAQYRGRVPGRILAQTCCIAIQSRPLSHDTKFVSQLNSLARPRARTATRPCAQPAVSWPVSWPYHAVSCVWPGLILAEPAWPCVPTARPVSRYNPLYRDSHKEEMGSSPFQPPLYFFFFFHIIFFLIPTIGKP